MTDLFTTETARPFLPARDFSLSKQFYCDLGFTLLMDSDEVAIFGIGRSSFLLQNQYHEAWAGHCMMQLMVDNLDAWFARIADLDLPARYPVKPVQAPAMQSWGLRIAYLADPSGVLWHIAQRRAGVEHDQ